MRANLQILLFALILLFGGSLEELLPKFGGVGVPLLLIAISHLAARTEAFAALAFALAAGAMEDALSALPLLTSGSYFVGCALAFRLLRPPRAAVVIAYLGYQLWLGVWAPGLGAEVFLRLLAALAVALAAVFPVTFMLDFIERRFAINDLG